ncbi:MAG: flagellar biosynthesis anti-sigma factor FlgM [Nitrospirae bacterium]|nr:flagellar biosynthesis anti-sigma factor FlgM [Nitrospirota bacterium]
MQVHGNSNVAAISGSYSRPQGVRATSEAKVDYQGAIEYHVTLSQQAREMASQSVNNGSNPEINADSIQGIESAISSGNYSIAGSSVSGHIIHVELLIDAASENK